MRLLAIAIAIFGLLFSVADGSVIVHKAFKERVLIKGKNATVSISVFNLGEDPVSNLVVQDRSFRNLTKFVPVAGKHSRLFRSIQPNETLSFWFVVKPTVSGFLSDEPATYKYKDTANVEHNGISSFYQAFPVFTDAEAAKLGAKDKSNKWPILAVAFAVLVVFAGQAYVETVKEAKAKAETAAVTAENEGVDE